MVISRDVHNAMWDNKKLQLWCQNGLRAQSNVTHYSLLFNIKKISAEIFMPELKLEWDKHSAGTNHPIHLSIELHQFCMRG